MISSDISEQLKERIRELKQKKEITILAHYYQRPEIQDIADFVGDSLALSRYAADTNAKTILFAGVHFMAQTAKIINPDSKVLLPDTQAGCSLADSCPPSKFQEFLARYPNHVVVNYINCSAEVKAMSDYICTSSNAAQIIDAIPKDRNIVFAPDKNLGKYLIKKTGRKMVLWDGSCVVHESFAIDKVLSLCTEHPEAKIVAHPESEPELLRIANFIGSTTAIIKYVENSSARKFIVATEVGIMHAMQHNAPEKMIIPAPVHENNTCACGECGFMKLNTLEKVYACMLQESPEIIIEEQLRLNALRPLVRMLEISKNG